MGAGAATSLATRLGQAGIPVSKIVLIEAWNPTPVSANVARLTHLHVSNMASLVTAAPGYAGHVENIDLRSRIPGLATTDHLAVSRLPAVHDLIIAEITEGRSGPAASATPRRR